MTKIMLPVVFFGLLATSIFALDTIVDDTIIDFTSKNNPDLTGDISLLNDDVFELIFTITRDIKSNSLSPEKKQLFVIDVENVLQSFHEPTNVAILPLVCKRFNKIIEKMREKGIFPYKKPNIEIPFDNSKITTIAAITSDSTLASSAILSLTSSGLGIANITSYQHNLTNYMIAVNTVLFVSAALSSLTCLKFSPIGRTRIFLNFMTLAGSLIVVGLLSSTYAPKSEFSDYDNQRYYWANMTAIILSPVLLFGSFCLSKTKCRY